MSSKVIGAMLIIGPILLIGPWMLLGVDTSDMSPSESLAAILADKTSVEMSGLLNIFGAMSMLTGLYFLVQTLKSDNAVSNACAEIGGLFLLLCVPIWVVMWGTEIAAIDAAGQFGNDVGATIMATFTAFQMSGILLVVGMLLLGISLTLLRKYKGIIGALFVIASGLAFMDMIALVGSDAVAMIGWMGMFATMLVTGILTTGILTTLQKKS